MKVLVCNAGSTSLKFKLFDMPKEEVLVTASMERIGSGKEGAFQYQKANASLLEESRVIHNYEEGIRLFLSYLTHQAKGCIASLDDLDAIGFKSVLSKGHYGTHVIDDAVLKGMEDFLTVAPAHNKHYLEAIRTFQAILPNTTMVGAFETAFHQTMPPEAYITTGPYEWFEKYGIRKLGYHGASHSYVADCLTAQMGGKYRAVSCHLGGSCSLAAIVDGKSMDTSFGLSLQTGLPQMSRAGDLDPYIIYYLVKDKGFTLKEVFNQLQTNGGIKGISGFSNDLRDIIEVYDTNERAKLALDIFIRELTRYIGGYAAIMGGIDAIAFTGGIGENSALVRNRVLANFAFLGIALKEAPKKEGIYKLTLDTSSVSVFVIPANEELGIARKVFQIKH